ncbi:MAG: VWA domain-containing protein, partial [Clostridia bacterium]|nr:VWA domain-containing protein [Clostridia bacterium]
MKTTLKKMMAIMLAAMILIACTSISVMADEEASVLEGNKQATLLEDDRYEVSIEIPGGDAEVKHDEIILMVDGSYSMDEEWDEMKETIITIGETVLDGSGHTTLTLMSFGISPNVVLEEIKTVEELAAKLPTKPGGLLYGRSATNCDGAFEGIQWYLDEHDETLGEANVIFLSDGGANMNSEKVDWIAAAGKISASNALAVQQDEFNQVVLGNAVISDASKTVYGDQLDEMLAKWKFVFDQEIVLGNLDAQMKALDPASEEYAAVKAQFDAELASSIEAS